MTSSIEEDKIPLIDKRGGNVLSSRTAKRYLASIVIVTVVACTMMLTDFQGHNSNNNSILLEKPATATPSSKLSQTFTWKEGELKDGVMMIDCSTSVSDNPHFWGAVGTTYTVFCPEHCASFGNQESYGTDIFMDDSVICKSAIARGQLGNCNPGKVKFQIVEPIQTYPAAKNMPTSAGIPAFVESSSGAEGAASDNGKCNQIPIETMPWTWTNWANADPSTPKGKQWIDDLKARPAFKCTGTPDEITKCGQQKAIEKFRWSCSDNKNDKWPSNEVAKISPEATDAQYKGECFGKRAFKILKAGQDHELLSLGGSASDFAEAASTCSLTAASSAITVELWVKDKNPQDAAYVSSLALGTATTADSGFALGAQGGSWAWGIAGTTSIGSGVSKFAWIIAPKYITDSNKGTWTHLAGTYDGKTMKFFVNGKSVCCGNSQSGNIALSTSAKLVIGALKDYGTAATPVKAASGDIDEIRIWNKAFDEADFTHEHMYSTVGDGKTLPEGLIVYYRFDGQKLDSKTACAESGPSCQLTFNGALKLSASDSPVTMAHETQVCDK